MANFAPTERPMASKEEINAELIHFIKSNLVDENIQIDENTPLSAAGLDSYSIVEIILFIERKYNVTIADEDLKPEIFSTVSALSSTVISLGR